MQHRKTLMLVLTALFAALTAVGAFFKIPFALAAISLQFLFTAMAGILLGAGYGALSQLVYVLIGLVGVPIFALGGGFSYVLHPTFGFLLGLIPAAWVIGRLARSTRSFWRIALAALLFGFFRALGNVYTGFAFLKVMNLPSSVYNMLPYIISLIVLAFTSKNSRAPKAEGIPYDKGQR